jgi:hypothetical protein
VRTAEGALRPTDPGRGESNLDLRRSRSRGPHTGDRLADCLRLERILRGRHSSYVRRRLGDRRHEPASPSIFRLREIDAAGERLPAAMVVLLSRPSRSRTMFSMPLAYPSSLDRRSRVAYIRDGRRPTWRSFGARASRAFHKKTMLKPTLIASVLFTQSLRVFLSQAGPRFDLDLLQAEHHLWFDVGLIAF